MDPQVTGKIITKYSFENNITSGRQLSAVLSEKPPCSFSHVTALGWKSGDTVPSDENLKQIAECYDDWRREMAWDCLRAKRDYYTTLVEAAPSVEVQSP